MHDADAAAPAAGGAGGGRLVRFLGGLLVVLVAAGVYGTSVVRGRADSRLSTLVSLSALYDGDLRLDEYAAVVNGAQPYLRDAVDGHIVSAYPIATPLLALPFVAARDAWERLTGHASIRRQAAGALPEDTEFFAAVCLSALGVLAMYAVGLALGRRVRTSVLLALGFGFCTPMWSVGSRGLWPQTTTMVGCTLLLLLAVTRRGQDGTVVGAPEARDRWWALGVGAVTAALLMIRPTHVLVVAPVLWARRSSVQRLWPWAVAGGAAVGGPMLAATITTYGTPFPRYNGMTLGDVVRSVRPWRVPEALAAVLVSPNRGLFAFTPVLLVGLALLVRGVRRPGATVDRALRPLLLACAWSFAGAVAVYAVWPVYWGGHSYGPRLLSDAVPFAWFPLATFGQRARGSGGPDRPPARVRGGAVAVLVVLAGVSVFAHARGARAWATYDWNVHPRDIDEHPRRVWDVRDLQVLRGAHFPGASRFQAAPCRSVPVPQAEWLGPHVRVAPGGPGGPVRAAPGETVWVRVVVENGTSVTLRSCGDAPVNLSYHVFAADGSVVQFDGSRRPLPEDVAPAARAEASIDVVAPSRPGRYRVRLALVAEGVKWFDDPGTEDGAVVELLVG